MNLPILVQKLYGKLTFTGLYSFEFVSKNRNTITEIFFLTPPKGKSVSEPTRASVVPTLGGNYLIDGGNATKSITLRGDLYFPYVGSPDNPVAKDNSGLSNVLTGYEEFLKLRWMLIRYRDYTMTSNAKVTVPTTLQGVSPEINGLYKKVSGKVKDKTGGLYDEIKLIFHDYDMDDHYYCKVDSFSSDQASEKHIAASYTITLECYEPDNSDRSVTKTTITKLSANESVDVINTQLQNIDISDSFSSVQAEVGYNAAFVSNIQLIEDVIEEIDTENSNIQSGVTTASSTLPIYVSELLSSVDMALSDFIDSFLSVEQKALYESGDLTIDELVDKDLLIFYNYLQKIKLQAESLQGVLNSIIVIDEIRYASSADDYTLTEEQFEEDASNTVENSTSFYYYTVTEGDTARIIALRELNNQDDFIKILQLNDITENDFIDGTLIGQQIKIPFPASVAVRGEDNLVYESDFTNLDAFLFGTDIDVSNDGEFLVSETGDILSLVGIENVLDNIESRINNLKGSLNVFNANWGTIAIDDSNAPLLVKIDRYLTDLVSQIQADPRVESVRMDLDRLDWNGEKISVPTSISFVGSDQTREVTV